MSAAEVTRDASRPSRDDEADWAAWSDLFSPRPESDGWPTIRGYELLGCAHAGGLSTVFRARCMQSGELVAVKVLRPELRRCSRAALLFWRGVGFKRRFIHRYILAVRDSGEGEHGPFVVTPWMAGGSLAERVQQQGALPWALTLRVARQLADALDFIHGQGATHRDVKLGNVLLDGEDDVRLADFGMASVWPRQEAGDGDAPGSSAEGDADDVSCDVGAFGAVLHAMLTGVPAARCGMVQDAGRQDADGRPRPRCERDPTPEAGLTQIAARAMSRTADERYSSMREVREELNRWGR